MTFKLVAAAGLAVSLPALAAAQSSGGEMAALESRIAELERQSSEGLEFTFGSGVQTSVDFYGFVRVSFAYDFDEELGNTTFPLGYLGTDSQLDGDGAFNATAQATRLGFDTTTDTGLGEVGTTVEIDFYGGDGAFGDANPYTPRVRQAYIDVGNLRVGKNWSTFVPLASYPSTLDFQGVLGIPFARQELIRYTQGFGDYTLEASIERSNGHSDRPVGVLAFSYDTDPLLLRIAGIYGSVDTGDDSEDNFYGVNLSGTVTFGDTTIDASYAYGEGIASYLVFLGGDVTPDGDLVESQSAYLAVSQSVGDRLTLRGMYGWRENDAPSTAFYEFERLTGLHVNAEYEVVTNTFVGLEYFRGTNDNFDGEEFEVDRIQGAITYNF